MIRDDTRVADIYLGEFMRLFSHYAFRESVALAREGQGDGWVAGSVGPYGAMLSDGSEYTGGYV